MLPPFPISLLLSEKRNFLSLPSKLTGQRRQKRQLFILVSVFGWRYFAVRWWKGGCNNRGLLWSGDACKRAVMKRYCRLLQQPDSLQAVCRLPRRLFEPFCLHIALLTSVLQARNVPMGLYRAEVMACTRTAISAGGYLFIMLWWHKLA